ncbi:MAG: MBL fold metallo-hydrolase [archaeon]|nr:MBL fold metallo-hydrolase [archaeon]MCP8315095.1 MBL fold metallo-hydrolase [archaeon]MCP8317856.1 MBL fold metallo-hydrolase [archaeon]MCP8319394.1 MBL fold metallo-hydrolase [archaeon]
MSLICKGVYLIRAGLTICYLVEGNEGLALIDTGMHGNERAILNTIKRIREKPSDLKLILLTHGHTDHAGNIVLLRQVTGAKVGIHALDRPYVTGEKKARIPTARNIRGKFLKAKFLFRFLLHPMNNFHPDFLLEDGMDLEPLGLPVIVIHTPGHTKGSVSIYLKDRRAVFIGDLAKGKGGKLTELPWAENWEQLRESLRRVLELRCHFICPSHGEVVEMG